MADNAKWYVAHTYSGYENAVKTTIEKFVANRHLEDMILDHLRSRMETVTEITDAGVAKEVRPQGIPGLRAHQDDHDRRHLASGPQCPRRDRLCRRGEQRSPFP